MRWPWDVWASVEYEKIKVERERLELAREQLDLTKKPINAPVTVPMPPDIWEYCNRHREEWARKDAMAVMYEAYEECGNDWNKVRERLPKG